MTASASIHPACPRCGAKVAADAPEGLCVRCLAKLNLTADSVLTGAEAPRSEPPSLDEIAPHFPQLEVLACLGRGGMGVVYKARQKSLDRLVALKILAPEREKDPQFAERFAREAQALAKLSHPHIVTVYDFGQADGLFYLLMEYVDGVNLRQLLRTRQLEPKEALAIVPPICDALQYAHDHAVAHRDIKPENLLLDKAGQVKIADFGIAKMLGGDSTPDDEQGVGTPHYMAPEQHATPQAADHRADIYSLGVVLYEMLTGELPASQLELPSRKVRIDVRLDEIVLRALNREPELRFQNAGQMKTAVETLTRDGQEAGPDTPPSVSRANRSKSPDFRGPRAMNVKMPIAITLLILFLAANVGILYKFGGRFSGNSPNARNPRVDFDQAIVEFDRPIWLDPETGDMRFYTRQTTAPESLRPNPQNPRFVVEAQRGLGAFERADYDQAIVAFDELIRLQPFHSEVRRWRGDASLNKREFDRALSEYDEAIRLDPRNGMAYSGRGHASMRKGEYGQAIASFDEAKRLDPNITNIPFYQRYRTDAQFPWSPGLSVVVLLLIFGMCVFLAFAVWPTLRHRKPEVDKDF
jgi:serine/threonine protein kinase